MSQHLSSLVLDEAQTGRQITGEVRQHLTECTACQARIERVRTRVEKARTSPLYQQTLTRVTTESPEKKPILLTAVVVVLASVALAVLITLWSQRTVREDDEDAVGTSTAFGLRVDGPHAPLWANDPMSLSVKAGGRAYVLVMAVDEKRRPIQIWPPEGENAGRAPKVIEGVLSPEPVAPAGQFVFYAFFGDSPLPSATAGAAILGAEALARSKSLPWDQIQLPRLPGERGRATAPVLVQSNR